MQGKPAVKRGARQKLEANCGKRGGANMSIDMAREDVVVLRWDPPENTTQSCISSAAPRKHLFQLAPVRRRLTIMTDQKENDTNDDKTEDNKEEKQ